MLKTNQRFSKLSLSLAATVVLSGAAGVCRANPLPTSSDEARTLAGKAPSANVVVPMSGATTTDEARALAGRSLVNSSPGVAVSMATSTDQARALAAAGYLPAIEKELPERSKAIVIAEDD
jgi:hypothetical protein